MYDGIINVYKEAGYTSHDVIAKMRGILSMKKIGHTGTLDPDATGVLPVCLGQATKLCDLLTDKTKTYRTTMLLGTVTDTQDISGTVQKTSSVTATESDVREAAMSYIGGIDQIPPMYSAIKIGGKKLVDLARAGIEVERKPRRIHIFNIIIEEINLPEVLMTVECSKGTYIRTLCHDIGEKLGCGACMKNLVRTRVSEFGIEDAIKLCDIERLRDEGRLSEYIVPIDECFGYIKNTSCVLHDYNKYAWNGNTLKADYTDGCEEVLDDGSKIKMYDCDHRFLGIYEWNKKDRIYKPWKLFIGGQR